MTTTKIDKPTFDQKETLRREIAEQVKKYLAKGGKITQYARNVRTETMSDGTTVRKFSSTFTSDSITDPTKRTLGGFVMHKAKEEK